MKIVFNRMNLIGISIVGYLRIVNIACGLVFIGMTVKAVDELREAVQTKYMLE